MECAFCKTIHPDYYSYCPNEGEVLDRHYLLVSVTKREFCSDCGQKSEEADQYCQTCGQSLFYKAVDRSVKKSSSIFSNFRVNHLVTPLRNAFSKGNKFNRIVLSLIISGQVFLIAYGFDSALDPKKLKGIRDTKWGMTVEEVIKMEESKGNLEFEDISSWNDATIQYSDIEFEGHDALVAYSFDSSIEGEAIFSEHDFLPSSYTEKYSKIEEMNLSQEQYYRKMGQLRKEYEEELSEFARVIEENNRVNFDEKVLFLSAYLLNLQTYEANSLKQNLLRKYGEPVEDTSFRTVWELKNTSVVYSHEEDPGTTVIMYSAKYNALKNKIADNE